MNDRSHPVSADDLNAYVDGVLATAERAWIDAQAARDPGLNRELAELRATARLLGELPELTPRRSFRLGAEYAKPTPLVAPAPGKLLQFLPIVRSLSVAAIMVFMVVAGALFFDINGNTESDSRTAFQRQNEIMSNTGVTESGGEASDESGDATDHPAPAAAEESDDQAGQDDGSSITSRGDAASAGDDPMEDLSQFEHAADDVASADQVAQSTDANAAASGVVASDDDRSSWVWTSVVLGVLAVALAGIWFGLAQAGRQSHADRS